MRRIFRTYAANGPNSFMEQNLPATDYEMLDLMERLKLEPGQLPYLEVLGCDDSCAYLMERMQEQPDIYQLNALAKQLAGLDGFGMAAFEGLVGMEIQKEALPIMVPRLIDLAYSPECCHVVEDAVTDYKLGRFLAENGFVLEAEELSDTAFELLDFRKIGREHRTAEGGVFTSQGYVCQHAKLRQVSETMDFQPRKPSYTILLNTAPLPFSPEKQDPIPIELPAASEQLQGTLERLGCAGWNNVMTAILDCPVPSWNHRMFLNEEVPQVIKLADRLRQLEADGKLTKFKAILAATDCQEVMDAVALTDTVDEYELLPDVRSLEDVAKDDLRVSVDDMTLERLLPHLNLPGYARDVLEQYNAQLTSYGRLDRKDGQPIQIMEQTSPGGMEMV